MVLPLFLIAGAIAGRLLLGGRQSAVSDRVLTSGLVVGAVWALIHPSWLLPTAVTAVGMLVKPGVGKARRLFVLACSAALAAVLLGSGMWHRVVGISSAGTHLAEWQRTDLTELPALPILAVAGIWLGRWISTSRAPDPAMTCTLLMLFVAGMAYWRNIAPVVLFALGLLAADLAANAGSGDGTNRWCVRSALPSLGAVVITTLVLSAAAVQQPIRSPIDAVADLANEAVCSTAGDVTIAAHYNDHGAALYGARRSRCPGSRSSRVPLDGRADRYGAELIERWQRAVIRGADWEALFVAATPTHAVLPIGNQLALQLQRNDWAPLLCREGYILLAQKPPRDTHTPV